MENFQEGDLVWFVDFLDKARHHITLSHWMLNLASRLSTVSILWNPLPGSVYANSEAYVRLTLHFQHPIQFLLTFLLLILIRLRTVALVRYIAGSSMAHRFVSNVCERLSRKISQ